LNRNKLDKNRQKLLAMVDAHPSYDLAGLSRLLGKNHAYLHQFIWKGSPRELREKDMRTVLKALGGQKPPASDPAHIPIPQYGFRAGMGGGGIIANETPEDHLSLPRTYLEQMQLASADLISIEVEGDSMSPTLESGDRIMINRQDRNPAMGDTRPRGLVCAKAIGARNETYHRPVSNPPALSMFRSGRANSSARLRHGRP